MLNKNLRIVVTLLVAVELGALAWTVQPDPVVLVEDFGVCEDPLPLPDYGSRCTHEPPPGFDQMVVEAASAFDIDPKILATTVYRESGCDADAVGAAGDRGLGQVVPKVWLSTLRAEGLAHTISDLMDPATNLRASAFILSRARDAAGGDLHGMFRRYNGAGPRAKRYADEQMQAYLSL